MSEIQKWFYYDSNWHSQNVFDDVVPSKSNRIYEVLRVVNGNPLFLQDHFARFEHSLSGLKIKTIISQKEVESILNETILRNKISVCNIRFELIIEGIQKTFAVYVVPFSYPTEKQYSEGVQLATFQIERKNPHVKQSAVNNAIRNSIKDIIEQEQIYEVLLVDYNGNITEGSRSNVVFVKDNCLYSPPAEHILEGITRKKVIHLARELNIEENDELIPLSTLNQFQACFITGTSPKILPVRRIGKLEFNVNNQIIRQLMAKYNQMIDES